LVACREIPHRLGVVRAEREMREIPPRDPMREGEIRLLLMLGREPRLLPIREHRIEHHQPFHGPRQRRRTPMAIVRLPDGSIERLVMDVVQPGLVMATRSGGRVATRSNDRKKSCIFWPYAIRPRAVVTAQTDARVEHDCDQKARLTRRESEIGHGSKALVRRHSRNSSARCGSGPRPPLPRLIRPPTRPPPARNRVKPDRAFAAAWAPR
jgi:hypothetical protein